MSKRQATEPVTMTDRDGRKYVEIIRDRDGREYAVGPVVREEAGK